MSLFVTWAVLLCVSSSSLSFTILFWPSQFLPLPSPPSYLLPPLAVAFCQSAYPPGRGGAFDPSLFGSPSLLSLSACASFQRAALCRFAALIHEQSPLLTVKPEFKDDIRWLYSGLSVRTCCSRKRKMKRRNEKKQPCVMNDIRGPEGVGVECNRSPLLITIMWLLTCYGYCWALSWWWAEFSITSLIRWWIFLFLVNRPLYLTVSSCHLSLESASPLSLLYLFTFSACSTLFSSLFRAFRHVFQ